MNDNAKSDIDKYLDHALKVMRDNEAFLRANSMEAYDEIVGLVNDTIDYIGENLKRGDYKEEYVKSSFIYFLNHVLTPVGGGIYINALLGNIPVCFMELRLALESLVKCYLADVEYKDLGFFQERLHKLEMVSREEGISISKLMKNMDKEFGFQNEFVSLWGRLSEAWVHAKGIMNAIVKQVVEESDIPAWGLIIPMNYASSDVSSLLELQKRISNFRCLLETVMQRLNEVI